MPEAEMSMVEQTWRMIVRSRRMIEASQALCIEETAHAAKCRHRLDASWDLLSRVAGEQKVTLRRG